MDSTPSLLFAVRLALTCLLLSGFGEAIAAPTVLVWSTGNTNAPGGNTPAIGTWLQASGRFGSVTAVDQNSTMTLAQLLAYDEVFYFSNTGQGQNPTAIGNVLADYADSGRRLVL